MNHRSSRFILALCATLAVCCTTAPWAGAADTTGIGYVDQAALSALPAFTAAKRDFDAYGAALQKQ